jgi:hypothetical protein
MWEHGGSTFRVFIIVLDGWLRRLPSCGKPWLFMDVEKKGCWDFFFLVLLECQWLVYYCHFTRVKYRSVVVLDVYSCCSRILHRD